MNALQSFPPPPPSDEPTLAEIHSHLVSGVPDDSLRICSPEFQKYPLLHFTQENLRPIVSRELVQHSFIEEEENVWRRALQAWYQRGFCGLVEEISTSEDPSSPPHLLNKWAKVFLASVKIIQNSIFTLQGFLFPNALLPNAETISRLAPVLNWEDGLIRWLAWHPQTFKLAVCLKDDSIRIYSHSSQVTPLLKHRLQKNVVQVEWKPFCASTLAVACQGGIFIWYIAPTSLVSRPSSSCMTYLQHKSHQQITSIAWHPDGTYLVSASAFDTSIYVWDVATENHVVLNRFGGGGVALLRFSPNGKKLLAAGTSPMFRVWDTINWTCERWSKLESRCHAACWSPNSLLLLFACEDHSVLYHLASDGSSNIAVPLTSLDPICLSPVSFPEEIWTGGKILNMVWDKKGARLAVAFKEYAHLIAVFRTCVEPNFSITPCGFIRGEINEEVQHLTFHDSFTEGSLLTVCWSTGRISHIPFLFPHLDSGVRESHLTTDPVMGPSLRSPLILSPKGNQHNHSSVLNASLFAS